MAEINTSKQDDQTIDEILRYGFEVKPSPRWPKYISMRLALNISLNIQTPPSENFDVIDELGVGIALKQLTGKGQSEDGDGQQDMNDAVKALLSEYHNIDLFIDEKQYRQLLQRHIRRGLHEIRTTWKRSHDFASWLNEELLSPIAKYNNPDTEQSELSNNEKLLTALSEVGIKAEIQELINGSRIDRYLLKLSEIHGYDLLKRSLEKIGFLLGLGDQGVFLNHTTEAKVIALDIPRPQQSWKIIDSSGLFDWATHAHQAELPVWLGEDVLGNGFEFDLADAPHLMIAGTTGSGKSVSLHALILSLLLTQSPTELQFAFIDPKLVELSQYQEIPHLYGDAIAHHFTDAMELLGLLIDEMEKRNHLFNEMGVSNLVEAVKQGKSNLPRIVVVIEELADLMSNSKEIESPLVRLAQKARSTGIHLVVATQRPDSATFSGLLRSNIPGRIALRVQKGTESRIILDETGAEKLLGAGDMLVKIASQSATRVHGAYINQTDIQRAIQEIKNKV